MTWLGYVYDVIMLTSIFSSCKNVFWLDLKSSLASFDKVLLKSSEAGRDDIERSILSSLRSRLLDTLIHKEDIVTAICN